jgi:4-aminobutyrate aminotransferase/(S)-3-amino-2-methylpropionate transaminase
MDHLESPGFLEEIEAKGLYLKRALEKLARKYKTQIAEVRGLGAMLAIELVTDPETKEPTPDLARAVIDEALRRGLILLKAGVHGNCIRVLCPHTIEDAVLDEALEVWEEALAAVLG